MCKRKSWMSKVGNGRGTGVAGKLRQPGGAGPLPMLFPSARLSPRRQSLVPAGWGHTGTGDLGMLMYAPDAIPSKAGAAATLAPPGTPKRARRLPAGRWVMASPLHDSSGPGQAFNRRLLSLAPGTEMPPPTPATYRAQPPRTPHGSWLRGWDRTLPCGAHHGPGTSSVPAGGEGGKARPHPLWTGGGSSAYCKAHVAAGMCHHTQPKLEVSLGFMPRCIAWPQPG